MDKITYQQLTLFLKQSGEMLRYMEEKHPKSGEETPVLAAWVAEKGSDLHPLLRTYCDELFEKTKNDQLPAKDADALASSNRDQYMFFSGRVSREALMASKKLDMEDKRIYQEMDEEIKFHELGLSVDVKLGPWSEEIANERMTEFIGRRTFPLPNKQDRTVSQTELDELLDIAKTCGVNLSISNVKGGEDMIEVRNAENKVLSQYKVTFQDDNVALARR